MKRLLSILLLAALLLSGCSTKNPYVPTGDALQDGDTPPNPPLTPDKVQSLSLPWYPDRSLNPFTCTDYTNRVLFSLIYQGLFTVSQDYQAAPVLCKQYNVSTDLKTYTFYLESATFSDGTSLTPEDVIASLNASMDSPWYGSRLQHIRSITGYGDAVVIELDIPMSNLPILLDIPIVKASQVNAETPIGTGPYRLDGSRLRPQAGWWCNASLPINADEIFLISSQSPASIRDSFEMGGVSIVCSDPGDDDSVDFRGDYELWDSETGLFLYLACNAESKIFSNEAIRCALTHAINRDILTDELYHGFAMGATLPASPISPYYNTAMAEKFGYQPEKFQTAVTEAALEDNTVIFLLCNADPIRLRTGRRIAAMLEAGGLNVTLTEVTSDEFLKKLEEGEYDLYLAQTKLSPNMDLSAFFGEKTNLNYGGLSNPSLYAMSQEALANEGNYYNLYDLVMKDGHLCPILFRSYAIYVNRGSASGLKPARDNLFYYDLGRTMADALLGTDS